MTNKKLNHQYSRSSAENDVSQYNLKNADVQRMSDVRKYTYCGLIVPEVAWM